MVIYWEGVAKQVGFAPIKVEGSDAKNLGLASPSSSYQSIIEPKPQVSTLMQDYPPLDPSYRIQGNMIVFQTSFGQYAFDTNRPSMSFTYRDGTPLIKHSAFYVNSSLPTPILPQDYSINMTSLSSNRLEYSANLKSLGRQLGTIRVSVLFDRIQRPKITVRVIAGAVLNATGFNVVWVVRGYGSIARLNGRPSGFDFTNFTLTNHSNFVDTSVGMGPSGPIAGWRVWALVDWSDAPAGASLGFDRFSGLQDLAGPAAMVIFPANLAVIDPTVVATSTLTGSAASYQRRVFYDGTRYWAFYHDGSNTVYKYSNDGVGWSNPSVLWSYQVTALWYSSGSVYALAGMTSAVGATVYLYFRKGTISVTTINWGSIVTVDSYTYSPPPGPGDPGTIQAAIRDVNLVVGSDGLITIIYTKAGSTTYTSCTRCGGAPPNYLGTSANGIGVTSLSSSPFLHAASIVGYASERYLQVRKSLDTAGSSWSGSTTILSQTPSDNSAWNNHYYPILSQLANNQIMGIYDDVNAIKYSISTAWTSVSTLASSLGNCGGSATTCEQFGSAVSDPNNIVRLVYVGADSAIKYAYYNGAWSSPLTIAPSIAFSPAIALGYGNDLHVSYLQYATSINNQYLSYVNYVRYSGFSGWGFPTQPFGNGYTVRNDITTEPNATAGLLLSEWTEGSASPYSIMVSSLPVESAWSPYSNPSAPWDKEGLIPYGHYFQNLNEFVDPSTGLLTVLQTDFALPGRGFDGTPLSFTRIFRTPFTFLTSCGLSTCGPYNYENYPYANLGLGWSLSWPWLGTDYVHLWNGQGYKIVWTNGVFENHQGDHFRLTMNANGTYTLFDTSGTIYQFDGSKRLTYMLDRTRNNQITFTYDASNRINYVTDTAGRTITFTYDTNSRLSTVNSGGRIWTYNYNTNGNLISVKDPLGRTTIYGYASSYSIYLLTQITYPTGAYTSYAYAQGSIGTDAKSYAVYSQNVTLTGNAVVRHVGYSYATIGSPPSTLNSTLTFTNSTSIQGYVKYLFTSANATQITENSQTQTIRKTIDVYNGQGAIKKQIIFLGNSASSYMNYFNFDNWGNTIYQCLQIDSNNNYRETFSSYLNSNTQNQFVYYNGTNVPGFTNSFYSNSIDSSIHDALIGQAEYQNGLGSNQMESYYSYDTHGNLLQRKNLLGTSTWLTASFTYDFYGNVLTRTDPEGNQTTFQYSPTYQSAYPTTISNVVSGVTLSTQYAYNFTTGDRITVTSPSGNVTDYRYDMIGRLTTTIYPSIGGVRVQRRVTYNDVNNIATIYDENNNYVKNYYDGLARLTKVETYSSGSVYSTTSYTYYWNDKTRTIIDPAGNVTTYNYDFLGRPTSLTHPDGTFRHWSYDDVNFIVNQYDEKSHLTAYHYDWTQRLTIVTEYPNVTGYNTVYTYDHVGNLLQINTALGQITTNTFDSLNRLVRTDYPDTTHETRNYDNVGNILSRITQNNTVIQYGYDQINRLTRITYPDGSTVTYGYDKDSNRLQMTDTASTTLYTYDPRNRLLSETRIINGQNYTLSYQYDPASNLLQLTYPDGYQLSYTYDALNRITSVGNLATSLTYRKDNRISTITYHNGVQTSYSYDKLGRTTNILTENGANILLELTYTYDLDGNLLTVNTLSGNQGTSTSASSSTTTTTLTSSTSTTTSSSSSVTSSSTSTTSSSSSSTASTSTSSSTTTSSSCLNCPPYGRGAKPLNVNSNQETYTYDDLNRVMTANGPWGSLSYTYDIVGNRLSETVNGTATPYTIGSYNKLLSAGSTSFTYDANGNRLTKNDGANSWSYSYDYENRLKQVTLNVQQVFQAWYDGDGRRIKTTDPSTTTVSDYLPGSWDPVYQKDVGAGVVTDLVFAGGLRIGKIQAGSAYYYHLDHLGSIRLTTDNAINQTFITTYKPYGSQYATSGNPERFTYTGKQQDASTGLFYYGYRYYDPQTGRFTTVDNHPAEIVNPQTINRYSYALNNPNSNIDPDGRNTLSVILKVLGFAGLIIGALVISLIVPELAPGAIWVANTFAPILLKSAIQEAYDDYQASAPASAIAAAQKTLETQVLNQIADIGSSPDVSSYAPKTGLFGGHLVAKTLFNDDDSVAKDITNQHESAIEQAHLGLTREVDSEAAGNSEYGFGPIDEGGLRHGGHLVYKTLFG